MLYAVVRHGWAEQPVLIDTYSTLNFYYALLCGLLCQLLGIRYCCVLRGGNLPNRLTNNPLMCRWLFGGATRLIAPSGYLQAAFQKAGYEVRVIPNPISLENYPFKLRQQIRPRLLWVRAFDAIYNPQMAIRVLHLLKREHPDATLCMVGPDKDGSLEQCRRLAWELGVADSVRFTGLLTKKEWIALSEDCDVFLNTTNVDNTPVSVIEAMALGLVVVSTNVGGLPDLIQHGESGWLVSKNDAETMYHAILGLIKNKKQAQAMSQNAKISVSNFDTMEVSKQLKNILLKYVSC